MVFIISLFSAFSQKTEDLFIPKEMQKAYRNKTRSPSGLVGENYFQNQTDYIIKAEFFPETRVLTAKETITYKNNSSDTLKIFFIKLYQDLFKKGAARDWDLGQEDIHEGVEIKFVKIGTEVLDLQKQTRRNSTIMSLKPTESLLPKSEIKIEIEWSLVISATRNVRMGTYGETNFMLAYWYPKMAVYDDISGWNTIPHTGSCEYYNEYGNFDVEMTLPEGYLAWSSGILQNAEELYTEKYLERINKAAKSDEIIHVITPEDRLANDILHKAGKNIWKFKIDNMPDFAMAFSNKYLWDATSVRVGERRVLVNAVYKENSTDFHEVAEISRFCVDYFSHVTPAIEFPYPQITIFNGSGGMEFPGMVNDGDARNHNGTLYVTSHEIGHSYFPFFVGTNEQKYAWVDEGLITFFPREIVDTLSKEADYNPFIEMIKNYNFIAGSFAEVPLMINSTNTRDSYRYHAYNRSSTAFYTLKEYLGHEKFFGALREYAKRWQGKHPVPFDLFFTFNQVAGEDLAWFWKAWFFELGSADLALGEFKNNKIVIENKGKFPVAIELKVVYSNGNEEIVRYKANVWKQNNSRFEIELKKGKIQKLVLGNELIPDSDEENNVREF